MVNQRQIRMSPAWLEHLGGEFKQPYMVQLSEFLIAEKNQGKVVFPSGDRIFAAFDAIEFADVRVVILGQDPYHGPGQAHGLSFSVPEGVAIPPSLLNIYKELESDIGIQRPGHGHLQAWADQGVLLLNSVLTVEQHQAASHQGKGWEQFTDKVIDSLNQGREQLVFMLWGAYAQKKGRMIDRNKHLVLQAPHPSPLSAHRGFIGCKHFSQANQYLQQNGIRPIEWQV